MSAEHDYLVDPDAPGDPTIEALEAQLREFVPPVPPLRLERPAVVSVAEAPSRRSWLGPLVAMAATFVLMLSLREAETQVDTPPIRRGEISPTPSQPAPAVAPSEPVQWSVENVDGEVTCEGAPVEAATLFAADQWLETARDGSVGLDGGPVTLNVHGYSRLRRTEAPPTIELDRGSMGIVATGFAEIVTPDATFRTDAGEFNVTTYAPSGTHAVAHSGAVEVLIEGVWHPLPLQQNIAVLAGVLDLNPPAR